MLIIHLCGTLQEKAVIAINKETGEIRSGQIHLSDEYTYYLLKFEEHEHYPLTRIEMAYYDMAQLCAIHMMPSSYEDLMDVCLKLHLPQVVKATVRHRAASCRPS